jgi:hypothetical protein
MRKTTGFFLLFTALTVGLAQQTPNPQSVFRSAVASLNAGNVGSVQMSGVLELPSGTSIDSGSFSAQCSISGTSQLQMQSSSGSQTENRQMTSGVATGNWIDSQGAAHPMANQNVQTSSAWFCPQIALTEILQSNTFAILFVGNETRNGNATLHYSVVSLSSNNPSPLSSSADMAQTEVYLDATTLQPVAFDFNIHPDDNASVNIPVEIQFSGYANSGGVTVPGTVAKYINGSLVLTMQVTSAASTSLGTSN